MKKTSRRLRSILRFLFLLLMIPLSSCMVMNARYRQWDKSVTRTPGGILTYAEPLEFGSGEDAVLMVHGFGDSPQVWESLAPALADKGYHVKAMRIPGWGEPVENKRRVTLNDWENAIRNEAARLKNHHNRVMILAHSMGGCLTTVLAQDQRLPADALVLYAPMLEVSSARSPLFKTRTWFKIGSRLLPDSFIVESVFKDHARVSPPRPKTLRDPFSPKHIYTLLYAEMDRFEAQVPVMDIPLRLVLPGEDRVVNNERSETWFRELNAPVKCFHLEKAAGHVLPLDVDVLAEADRLDIWFSEQAVHP